MRTEVKTILIDFIDYINESNYDIKVIENYTGKGMYGDLCVGFCGRVEDFIRVLTSFLIQKEVLDYSYHRFNDTMSNISIGTFKNKQIIYNPEWRLINDSL